MQLQMLKQHCITVYVQLYAVGLGQYMGGSVHHHIFSDDPWIDTPTQISIHVLPFFKKNSE
jgi:hypothetical protein